jgi:hypothetical protein
MAKKVIIGVLVVFIVWSALDYVIHGVILQSAYEATAHLWRPMEEMKMGLMYVVGILVATFFVLIYAFLIQPKSLVAGLKYGLLFGLAAGISMGYGSFCYMPIPYSLAFTWFAGTVVEITVGGLLVGLIVKEGEGRNVNA